MFRDMDFGEKAFTFFIFLGVGLLTAFILSDKHVRGYYLGSVNETNKGYCVSADITWSSDPVAYCSDDINKTLEVYNQLR